MKRTLAAVLALFVAAPGLARAQSYEEPAECTTTTTVRCTGAAARYAVPPVPGAQPPPAAAPAPPPIAPPIVAPPPGAYPPPAYQYPYYNRPVIYADLRLGDGWKLVQDADGTLWKERKVSTASPGLLGAGLALFGVTWLGGIIGGAVGDNNHGIYAYSAMMPVFGAWANAAMEADSSCYSDYYGSGNGCSGNKDLRVAGWAIDGVLQATGFIMFLIGTASGPQKTERRQITVIPGAFNGGGGLNAVGQF